MTRVRLTRALAALLAAVAGITPVSACQSRSPAASFHRGVSTPPVRRDLPLAHRVVLGHRGGVEQAHENTMAAFDDAISVGVDYIETDVRHSADGVAFLLHDPVLPDACTPYAGLEVRVLNAVHLAEVRCAGQPLPRLSDLVSRLERPDAARISVMVEVKDVDPLGVRDELAPLGWSRVLIQSFDLAALREIEQASPQVRTCPLFWTADVADRALAVTHDCVGPEFHAVDAGLVAKAHAAGAVVFPFTVDDPAAMRSLIELGVDGLITDRPRLAREALGLDHHRNQARQPQ
ncbi:glycerophosphodiester phosphodiesterase [Planosporangium mesophilum]|uniref:Glycerophosphoryl diester phosphodiesterase n=1 Tax=Planosporangium mesophilum TaxID=689768 RepID=A0A8J3TAE3_9ACTN|nr:glycerophosphodiester phosphodiesterase family protein [Planosporangium mesophilum]NJC81128.1 hypothetical protein [Planosporangium mesophilum]GII21224.1 glycerophosphoryl diester phosphodiesterase [Planosporangium mesophilum]